MRRSMGQPNNLSSHPPQLSTGVSQCVAPHFGEVGSNWRVLSGGLPRWALGPSAPDLCGVAEGAGDLWLSGVEAPGSTGVG